MSTKKYIQSLSFKTLLVVLCLFYLPSITIAQSGDDGASGKAEARLYLDYTEVNNHSKMLKANVKAEVDKKYVGIKGVTVHFYQQEVSPEQFLGTASTNRKGIAVFIVPEEKLTNTSLEQTYIATIENDNNYADNEEAVSVSKADFNMTLDKDRQVLITLQAPDSVGNMMPISDTDVNLYVQRMFGLLPLPDNPETTDENGEITVEFPSDIPGDAEGNLVIVAKVEDHEQYGNLEFRRKINWGVPLVMDPSSNIRELWSSRANAPLYLILIVNILLVGVWGVIAYLIYDIFQIKKIGRQNME